MALAAVGGPHHTSMLKTPLTPWNFLPRVTSMYPSCLQLTPRFPSPQVLQERRARCETQNTDPVVWTNQRVLKWVRDIDLKVRDDGGGDKGVIL